MQQPFVMTPQYFGSLVFDRKGVRYLPFDQDATQLLRQLVNQPIGDCIAQTECLEKRTQYQGFYFQLEPLGMFDERGLARIEINEVPPQGEYLSAPLVVHVEVIGACNIACSHCFAGQLPRNENPLTLDEFDDLFAQLVDLGCFRVSLTGGEPLMRSDIFDIIDAAQRHGLAVALTTNAMLIDDTIARRLGQIDSLRLTVSLDGGDAETNDSIRGEGVFGQVSKKLEILRRYASFAIGFTITKKITSEIDKCVETAKKLGASAVVFRPLYPTGVATQNEELMPTFEEYTDAINSACVGATLEEDITELESQCGAGELLAGINVQGDVNPCSFLGPKFASGNIRDRSFKEIWNDGQKFKQIRDFPVGENSESKSGCSEEFNGGCRCRAQHFSGDANGTDPWHAEYQSNPNKFFFPLKNLVAEYE